MGLKNEKVSKLLNNENFVDADIYAIQECEEKDITPEIEKSLGKLQDSVNAGEKFPDFASLKFPLSGKKIY